MNLFLEFNGLILNHLAYVNSLNHLSRRLCISALLWLTLPFGITPVQADALPRLSDLHHFEWTGSAINALKVSELSGMVWDQDEQLLYAVSDKGNVFHFKITVENDKIESITPVYGGVLKNKKAKPLDWRDAEGLDGLKTNNGKRGDSELIITFEGIPRMGRFTPNGHLKAELPLPAILQERKNYRARNNMLESVTMHPQYGYLTAPEQPLKRNPENVHTVYSRHQQWSFMAYPADNSAITALQVLPNRNVLVLERAWSGVLNPLVISLRYLDFKRCAKNNFCEIQDLWVSSSLFLVDNFEGLTHLRDNLYLMVSDDGNSRWQRTVFTLFRLELP